MSSCFSDKNSNEMSDSDLVELSTNTVVKGMKTSLAYEKKKKSHKSHDVMMPLPTMSMGKFYKSDTCQINGVAPDAVQNILQAQGLYPVKDYVGHWTVPKDVRKKRSFRAALGLYIFPFYWPLAVPLHCLANQELKGYTFILCRDKILVCTGTKCGCCKSGKKVEIVEFEKVLSVAADERATGCACCLSTSGVNLTLAGLNGTVGGQYGNAQQRAVRVHCAERDLAITVATIRKQMDIAKRAAMDPNYNGTTQIIVNSQKVPGPVVDNSHSGLTPKEAVIQQLWGLKDLCESGVITQAEYDAKKAELLKRM